MTQQLSNCCKAQVSVDSGDEGTSCFMCSACKKDCDLFAKEAWENGSNYDYIMLDNVRYVILKPESFERLKRLDENVKNKIDEFKSYKYGQHFTSVTEVQGLNDLTELLENLDK